MSQTQLCRHCNLRPAQSLRRLCRECHSNWSIKSHYPIVYSLNNDSKTEEAKEKPYEFTPPEPGKLRCVALGCGKLVEVAEAEMRVKRKLRVEWAVCPDCRDELERQFPYWRIGVDDDSEGEVVGEQAEPGQDEDEAGEPDGEDVIGVCHRQ